MTKTRKNRMFYYSPKVVYTWWLYYVKITRIQAIENQISHLGIYKLGTRFAFDALGYIFVFVSKMVNM